MKTTKVQETTTNWEMIRNQNTLAAWAKATTSKTDDRYGEKSGQNLIQLENDKNIKNDAI